MQEHTCNNVDFSWGNPEQTALEAFCSAPILAYPDNNIYVLSQVQDGRERVIMYGSKELVGSQAKWCTTHRELWALV